MSDSPKIPTKSEYYGEDYSCLTLKEKEERFLQDGMDACDILHNAIDHAEARLEHIEEALNRANEDQDDLWKEKGSIRLAISLMHNIRDSMIIDREIHRDRSYCHANRTLTLYRWNTTGWPNWPKK